MFVLSGKQSACFTRISIIGIAWRQFLQAKNPSTKLRNIWVMVIVCRLARHIITEARCCVVCVCVICMYVKDRWVYFYRRPLKFIHRTHTKWQQLIYWNGQDFEIFHHLHTQYRTVKHWDSFVTACFITPSSYKYIGVITVYLLRVAIVRTTLRSMYVEDQRNFLTTYSSVFIPCCSVYCIFVCCSCLPSLRHQHGNFGRLHTFVNQCSRGI